MMQAHATAEELQALRRRELDPDAIVALTRHLADCESCAALARGAATPVRHPDLEEELFPYVDGTLGVEQRRKVAEHLLVCARCREDVADAEHERDRRLRPRRMFLWSAAAAAAAALIVTTVVTQRRPAPSPTPVPRHVVTQTAAPRPAEWESLVVDALKHGRIDRPAAFESVRREDETLRGSNTSQHAAVSPAGVVVITTRPEFHWPSNGEPAVVSIFDGANRVAKSGMVTASSWTPEKPLARDRVYTWQVEFAGTERLLPEPPDPPARFRIVDETSLRELDAARQSRPDDHLLLGILAARAGLKREALEDLARSQDARAAALAASVKEW